MFIWKIPLKRKQYWKIHTYHRRTHIPLPTFIVVVLENWLLWLVPNVILSNEGPAELANMKFDMKDLQHGRIKSAVGTDSGSMHTPGQHKPESISFLVDRFNPATDSTCDCNLQRPLSSWEDVRVDRIFEKAAGNCGEHRKKGPSKCLILFRRPLSFLICTGFWPWANVAGSAVEKLWGLYRKLDIGYEKIATLGF